MRPNNPSDYFVAPSGNVWTTMCFFNLEQYARAPFPEVGDGDDIPDWINAWRCRSMAGMIARASAAENDHVALVRIAEEEEGFPRLLLTYLKLDDMRAQRWKVRRPSLALDDPSRTFVIEGEMARIHQMHPSFAVMRWQFDFDDFPRREWFFPLWRWQLALAALGPVSFEMMPSTDDATEDDICASAPTQPIRLAARRRKQAAAPSPSGACWSTSCASGRSNVPPPIWISYSPRLRET